MYYLSYKSLLHNKITDHRFNFEYYTTRITRDRILMQKPASEEKSLDNANRLVRYIGKDTLGNHYSTFHSVIIINVLKVPKF
jgi:hypothetical protein